MLSPLHPLQLAFGLILWAIWFIVVYSAIGIACGLQALADNVWTNIGLMAFTLVVAGYLLWSAGRCRRAWRELSEDGADPAAVQTVKGDQYPAVFIASLACGVNALAGFSTLLAGVSFLLFAPCIR